MASRREFIVRNSIHGEELKAMGGRRELLDEARGQSSQVIKTEGMRELRDEEFLALFWRLATPPAAAALDGCIRS
jgi:hypothetical protein